MFRKHWFILMILLLLAGVSLLFGGRVLADLSAFDPATNIFETKLVLAPDTLIPADQEIQLLEARPVIARRLDKLAINGPYHLVIRHGQLEVTLPRDGNIPYIASVMTSIGEIAFIDGGAESPPVGQTIKTGLSESPPQILFTSREVTGLTPPNAANGQIFYLLTLEAEAATRLAGFVAVHPNSFLCIALDDRVINCSTMYHLTDQTLEIMPELSSGDAASMSDLAIFLHSGPLTTRLKVLAN
jgi:hypothetical protein